MERADLARRIDHTALGPATTAEGARRAVDGALEHGMNARVPPCYVGDLSGYAPSVTLVTVCGFPHGNHATATKREEAVIAWQDGADEIDVVVNLGRLRAGERDAVRADIEEVVAAVPVPVTAIVETGLVSDGETHAACEAAAEAGASFVGTSTGFAEGGATVEDVRLMADHLPVKASGGVRSWRDARALLEAGAERIGTSSGAAILSDFDAAEGRE